MDVQEALDAPRGFRTAAAFEPERGIPAAVVEELARRGHPIQPCGTPWGGGQAILIDHVRGIFSAGSDPRKDGCALTL
jgi:gamma-glutamyltranspeptidase / glutathione hydrolase